MSRSCRGLASGLLLGRDLKIHGRAQSPKGPITSKALKESICQGGAPGIPKGCPMVRMMWLLKPYQPEGRP
jgi:hypothetical protein